MDKHTGVFIPYISTQIWYLYTLYTSVQQVRDNKGEYI